ncbi:carboxypeptidase-like regulatory domain-containing protein [Fimbriiglobus ruber]|uniref:Carboxypeptidase regulatory-like domain-containing protein n=1 Tax=Fimbriiglobus ruber TaxID=1908690 RepID=A0A225DJY3_9BACT|nr:carboxypeptidase-like regulatory domain-containing protein [Fimbriiglobus ruber]OWK36457.1 hypothetical protein FRUB_09020 [Fimbriiglobus ruber]
MMWSRIPARSVRLLVVVALVVPVVGCGKPHGDVAGRVTYRGRPVVYGTVNAIGSDQMTYYGTIQTDGTFTIRNVPVGPLRLGIYSPDPYYELPVPPAVKVRLEEARRAAGADNMPKPPKGQWFKIPPKYTDPMSSTLTGVVTAPLANIDCNLD